ncbi:hypothetical protein predicted by Glimmer/Critica [Sorangium cellulosum So ce56]|uniref:Uncharacterized protein n=1 Tax=Sorangium cellulosum (strain So ce56) TaxID=448385 RepID=A9GP06_SORC5|nr:hypothetical protein predicted by Glimmer/Critica [Sorangium cellulosum So ce56]
MGYAHDVRERDAHHVEIDRARHVEYRDPSEFDRIAFAMRTLDRLRPKRMTVAVYPAIAAMRVERGSNLQRGEGGSWAIVGIPPHASREHIAYALAELAGVESVPYAVQSLLAADRNTDA